MGDGNTTKLPIDELLDKIREDIEEYIAYAEAREKEEAAKKESAQKKTKATPGEAKSVQGKTKQTKFVKFQEKETQSEKRAIKPQFKKFDSAGKPILRNYFEMPLHPSYPGPSYVIDADLQRMRKEMQASYDYYQSLRDTFSNKYNMSLFENRGLKSVLGDTYPSLAKAAQEAKKMQDEDNKPSTSMQARERKSRLAMIEKGAKQIQDDDNKPGTSNQNRNNRLPTSEKGTKKIQDENRQSTSKQNAADKSGKPDKYYSPRKYDFPKK